MINCGDTDLINITVTDVVDGVATQLASVPGPLPAGGSFTYSGSYVATHTPSADSVTARAIARLTGGAYSATTNASCMLSGTPAIAVTKVCDGAPFTIGQPIRFRGTVTNTGSVTLTSVTVVDDHAGTVLAIGSLAAGASSGYSGSYAPTGNGCGPFTDTVTASGAVSALCGGGRVQNTASVTCSVVTTPCIRLQVICTDATALGNPINVSATVSNCGNVQLTNLSVTDTRGSTYTCTGTVLNPGESTTCTGSYTPTACGAASDTITASANDVCTGNPVSDIKSATCQVPCFGRICVTKEVACVIAPDTCGTFGGSATGVRGDTQLPAFCYRINVSNCGSLDLQNVSVTDTVYGVLGTIPSFPVAATRSFTFMTELGGDTTNTVTAMGTTVSTLSNVSASASATALVQRARIECIKQVSTNGVDFADVATIPDDGLNHMLTYKITVTNASDAGITLTSINVSDPVLAGCDIASQVPASLLSGHTFEVVCTVQTNCSQLPERTLRNVVTVSAEVSSENGTVCVRDQNGNPITVSSMCSALVNCQGCQLVVIKRCAIPTPPPAPFVCSDAKPITSLVVKWNGTQTIFVRTWNGSIGTGTPSVFGPIAPGQNVTFTRTTASTPNDIYFELFTDASLSAASKLGNSTFHLSCSDVDMNGPEDCGKVEGDGKGLTGFINQWIFVGMGGNGLTLDCSPTPPSTVATNTVCDLTPVKNPGCGGTLGTTTKPTSLTFRYTGGGCAASSNPQSGKFVCSGQVDTSLPISVSTANGYTISPTVVAPGEEFTVSAGSFNAQSGFTLSNSGGTETLSIHTSCSQLLQVGDVFGDLTLVAFNGQGAGNDVIYVYTVTNTGSFPLQGIVLTDDKLGPIAGPFDLAAGASTNFQLAAEVSGTVTNTATAAAGPSCVAHSNPVIVRPPPTPPTPQCPANICASFNGTKIAAGNYIWFNGVVNIGKRDGKAGTATFTDQHIQFTAGGVSYDLPAPDALIVFSSTATLASQMFDTSSNQWVVTVPVKYNGNVSIGGLAFQVPAGGLPGGIKKVCWSGGFGTDIGKVEFNWKWAAAVYKQFSADYNALGVKAIDGDKLNPYKNGDHAGTPENFKKQVVGGARGGGGANATGSYSGTQKVICGTTTPSQQCTSAIVALRLQYTGANIAGPVTLKFVGSQSTSTIVATYLAAGGLTTGTILDVAVESDPNRPWTIDATKHNQTKLGTQTSVYINNVLTEVMHTSCSCPIIIGQPACLDASSPDNPTGTKGYPSPLFLVLDFK